MARLPPGDVQQDTLEIPEGHLQSDLAPGPAGAEHIESFDLVDAVFFKTGEMDDGIHADDGL